MNGNKRHSGGWLVGVLCLGAVFCLSGCVTGKPSGRDSRDILSGKKSLVLFRLTQVDSNAPAGPKYIDSKVNLWDVDRSMTNAWLHKEYEFFKRGPSEAATSAGWRYLVLPAGTYFLQFDYERAHILWKNQFPNVVPRRGENAVMEGNETAGPDMCYAFDRRPNVPAYALRVPEGSPVIYAGSFQVTNWSERVPDWPPGFFKTRRHSSLSGPVDESKEAKRIVSESMPELGVVQPGMAMPFDYPATSVRSNQLDVRAEKVSPYSTVGVGDKPAIATATILGAPGAALYKNSLKEGEYGNGLEGVVIMIAAGTIAAAVDVTVGESIRKEWSGHEAKLVEEYQRFGLQQQLSRSVDTHMQNVKPTSNEQTPPKTAPYSMQIEPYRTCLRETRSGEYALEIAVHVKLTDTSTGKPLWENFLVYSDRQKAKNTWNFLPFPFETLVPGTSTARPLKQYKGEAGVQNFHDDLVKAVDGVATEIAARLK